MIVSIKSQCDKKALTETRRVLDHFFERAGDRCWEGAITELGLTTVRKMLRKTARKNTAVVCHRVHGTGRLELEWIIGKREKFNFLGKVPTNSTSSDVLRLESENQWHRLDSIALLAAIAGLFHDFGKASVLFQQKLKGLRGSQEPLRHEWLSLLAFSAFIKNKTDQEWLQKLVTISEEDEASVQKALKEYQQDKNKALENPFVNMPALARVIGWLIVSHHRLPIYPKKYGDQEEFKLPEIKLENLHIANKNWDASWNSRQCTNEWSDKDWHDVFVFPAGSPIKSQAWRARAKKMAQRALSSTQLLTLDWLLDDNFSSHLARLSLMLADHSFSALPPTAESTHQGSDYAAYANTHKNNQGQRQLKQRLDEHNIGVSSNAFLLAKQLPKIRQEIPSLLMVKALSKRTTHADYLWQNKAYEVAQSVATRTEQQGFFGVNMASTGKGKTFANARIMFGLSNEKRGCRFSVALGLRTLTLQTGDALRERLKLDTDELAVLVGSQAVQELHEMRQEQVQEEHSKHFGSESAQELMDEQQNVFYDGTLDSGPLSRWLKSSVHGAQNKTLKMLSAPVLVSTIDHLIPATEGVRGGKQIAPMLRLLTSDLVLDEPDDFDTADLPALCRLVNWAGLLGSKVLLSSASLPPVMVRTVFEAYLEGRRQYDRACGVMGVPTRVCCAWFDEFYSTAADCSDLEEFKTADREFVNKRLSKLGQSNLPSNALRKGDLIKIPSTEKQADAVISTLVSVLDENIKTLHLAHHELDPKTNKKVSLGLVRIANINALTALAQKFATLQLEKDWCYHLCVYHSQFPLLVRSHIEARLDSTLSRHDEQALWQQPEIRQALDNNSAQQYVFIVLGSPVTEVGRDHDYHWAIAEPSSIRSVIQLAGRVQRHRKQVPTVANVLVLEKNIRALQEKELAYCKPGFEAKSYGNNSSNGLMLDTNHRSLFKSLSEADLKSISSVARIEQRSQRNPTQNIVDLEHAHLNAALRQASKIHLQGRVAADYWWKNPYSLTWSAELQRRTPFRQSSPDEGYVLYQEDENEAAYFCSFNEQNQLISRHNDFEYSEVVFSTSVQPWLETEMTALLADLAQRREQGVDALSERFGETRLRVPAKGSLSKWQYHPWLGVYQLLK
ncbi:MAG: type I-F CRISPR-associated helicase Cas3f [Venatoribacter sp.]